MTMYFVCVCAHKCRHECAHLPVWTSWPIYTKLEMKFMLL